MVESKTTGSETKIEGTRGKLRSRFYHFISAFKIFSEKKKTILLKDKSYNTKI